MVNLFKAFAVTMMQSLIYSTVMIKDKLLTLSLQNGFLMDINGSKKDFSICDGDI